MAQERPCELCGAEAGDVFARRREGDARILVCYRCFGRGIDEGTLVDQMSRPVASPPAASPSSVMPRSASAHSQIAGQQPRIEDRDTGDLLLGFGVGFLFGLVALLLMRLFLAAERRRDKIYGGWFGWAAGTGVGLLLYSLFGS